MKNVFLKKNLTFEYNSLVRPKTEIKNFDIIINAKSLGLKDGDFNFDF